MKGDPFCWYCSQDLGSGTRLEEIAEWATEARHRRVERDNGGVVCDTCGRLWPCPMEAIRRLASGTTVEEAVQ